MAVTAAVAMVAVAMVGAAEMVGGVGSGALWVVLFFFAFPYGDIYLSLLYCIVLYCIN